MSRHRAQVRPRYGRIALLASSLVITGVAMLGGIGVIPTEQAGASSQARGVTVAEDTDPTGTRPEADAGTALGALPDNSTVQAPAAARGLAPEQLVETLPPGSGQGRRVVFSESLQRVWLVGDGNQVARTYLASGSTEDNLDPGTYEVYSRSEEAYGIDDSGTMNLFVRFTQGPSGAAIGFHDIPVKDGVPVQTRQQLGTPLSHGCIRQRAKDAAALWGFAPIGTKVVVTA